jgi:hypothetical protein
VHDFLLNTQARNCYKEVSLKTQPVLYPVDGVHIVPKNSKQTSPSNRVAPYRPARQANIRRIEVAVPAADIPCIRALARILRKEGDPAERLRAQFDKLSIARTGNELVRLLRQNAHKGFIIDLPARKPEPLRNARF